ncbi:hypothetical protein GCM10009777_11000 [Microbacterium pumilum]|uniref:Uncharacterized protein n=1 Tax=Microbacterium pumilum TaxID=344165 RepID=A0ABN2S2V5_9MICO
MGVFQRVDARFNRDGTLKKDPRESTVISVSGDKPVSVKVPVSSTDARLVPTKGHAEPPKKVDVNGGVAEVAFTPEGVADKKIEARYDKPLPVDVAVSYTFNGEPVSAEDVDSKIKNKKGTVQITYTLTNTTSTPVTACFTGFDGQPQTQTLTTPLPILAYLTVTVPDATTSFTAPGAAPSHSKSGVAVGWTGALFEPFGSTKQSFTLTMTTAKSSVPQASVILATLDPWSITGQVAAASAQSLGTAQAAARKAMSAVETSLDAIQQRMSSFQGSSGQTTASGARSPISLPAVNGAGVHLPGVSIPAIQAPSIDTPALLLPPVVDFTAPQLTVPTMVDPGLPLPDFAGLHKQLAVVIGALDAGPTAAKLAALETAVSASAGNVNAVTEAAKALADLTKALKNSAQKASDGLDGIVAQVPPALDKAVKLRQLLDQIQTDVDALQHPADAALQKVNDDLTAARDLTDALVTALTNLDNVAHTAQADVAALKTKVTTLERSAADLVTTLTGKLVSGQSALEAAQTDAAETIMAQLGAAGDAAVALGSKLDAEAAQSDKNKGTLAELMDAVVKRSAQKAVQEAEDKAAAAVAKAHAAAQNAVNSANATLGAAIAKAKAATADAAARAAQQASLAIQDAEASAREAAGATAAEVGDGVTAANDAFAQLLCLNQQALLHQLPAGSATGVSSQNGRFAYIIEGS